MENFMLYLLKTSIWIAIFWLIYRFFLRNELFFRFNRIFLLSGLIASFGLAMCQFNYPVDIEYQPVSVFVNSQTAQIESVARHFDWITITVSGIYLSGVVLLISYHLLGLYRIRKMMKKKVDNKAYGYKIIDTHNIKSSFSLFGYVFMDMRSGMSSDVEKQLILEHEKAHIEQKHWLDIVLAQIVCTLLWFNPFAWLYLSAVKQNHEYLADRSVLKQGHSPAVYNAVLVNSTFKVPVFTLTNSFTYNKLKRITMMKKNDLKPAKKLAVLFIAPAFLAFSWAFAKPEYHYSIVPIQEILSVDKAEKEDSVKVIGFGEIRKVENLSDLIMTVKNIEKIKSMDSVENEAIHVKGKVLDTEGKAIPGAVVVVEGGKTGSVTDVSGNFEIKGLNLKGKVLAVSFVEKETKKFTIDDGNTDIVITLNQEKKQDPVKIVRSENKITVEVDKTSVSLPVDSGKLKTPLFLIDGQTASEEDVKKLQSVNIEDLSALTPGALEGKSGVIIITTKKETNEKAHADNKVTVLRVDDSKIKPFVLVDGQEYSGSINSLAPEDIESISVLKNETATRLYGEKGRNGVILITTKKKQ
jgi:TonB-dependent SusC/RagA subfamily outer membrane receptor